MHWKNYQDPSDTTGSAACDNDIGSDNDNENDNTNYNDSDNDSDNSSVDEIGEPVGEDDMAEDNNDNNLEYSEAGEDIEDEDEGVASYFHALPSATWEVQEVINPKDQGFVSEHFLIFMEEGDNWMVVQIAQRDNKTNSYKLRPAKRKNDHLTILALPYQQNLWNEMKRGGIWT